MRLNEYLTSKSETAEAFAARIGRATSTVTRLRNGETRPDSSTMERIIKATSGAVTPNDFYDLAKSNSSPRRQAGAQ